MITGAAALSPRFRSDEAPAEEGHSERHDGGAVDRGGDAAARQRVLLLQKRRLVAHRKRADQGKKVTQTYEYLLDLQRFNFSFRSLFS